MDPNALCAVPSCDNFGEVPLDETDRDSLLWCELHAKRFVLQQRAKGLV